MIEVRYFGLFAEIAGCAKEKIAINESIPVAGLMEHIREKYLEMSGYPMMISLNNKICEPGTILRSGTAIDCMPPFSGG